MPATISSPLNFGELLRQLRRRAGLTQGELAARVGYSVALISRLEQNERLPAVATIAELFIPALELGEEPHLAHRLVELAALARGERPPTALRVSRTVAATIDEQVVELPGYVPASLIRLVGRGEELATVCKRLLAAPGRLLTLIGPPGVGKTQLSLAVAAQVRTLFRDGAWFVPLAAVDDAEVVATTIATALALNLSGPKTPATRLIEHLRRRETLLVLDNLEQVTACAPLLVTLLQECAGLRILVTSTVPLRLRAEQRHKVPPLVPAAGVELFIQRAQAVEPDFAVTAENAGAITELCLRLDCLPLAIELIAAQSDLLTPAALLARVHDERLAPLAHGPHDLEAHHRTLRTAIERSYALLGAREQALFRSLGVFAGGCEPGAVTALGCDEQTLRSLAAKSMLHPADGLPPGQRYNLLATLRDFALEMLDAAGETYAAHRRHADYFLALGLEASRHWYSSEHQQWLDRLEAEQDNLRGAMRWLIDHDGAGAQELGAALREFWYLRGPYGEARTLLAQALRASAAATRPRGLALLSAARLAHAQDDNAAGLRQIEECVAILRQCGDEANCAEALRTGGWIAHSAGHSPRALAMFSEALALSRSLGAAPLTADLYISIAQLHALDGDEANFPAARGYFAEGRRLAQELGRQESVAYALHGEASLALMAGDYAGAAQLATEALAMFRLLEFRRSVPLTLLLLGEAALLAGDPAAAHSHALAALAQYSELDIPWGVAAAGRLAGQAAHDGGRLDEAAARLAASLASATRLADARLTATNLADLGGVALAQQEHERAALLLAAAHRIMDGLPRFLAPGYRTRYAAYVDAARAALGDARFAATWSAGQALAPEQALALGLTAHAG